MVSKEQIVGIIIVALFFVWIYKGNQEEIKKHQEEIKKQQEENNKKKPDEIISTILIVLIFAVIVLIIAGIVIVMVKYIRPQLPRTSNVKYQQKKYRNSFSEFLSPKILIINKRKDSVYVEVSPCNDTKLSEASFHIHSPVGGAGAAIKRDTAQKKYLSRQTLISEDKLDTGTKDSVLLSVYTDEKKEKFLFIDRILSASTKPFIIEELVQPTNNSSVYFIKSFCSIL